MLLFRKELKLTQGLGITYGVSQGITFFAFAALFYIGAYLIAPSDTKPDYITINFEEMMM